ncbi:MAG TPA: diguanylate cyclase [Burkholderiales bacterium]|nr:diguanylate cyclase [Burkholderiales bacterium]
MNGTYDLILVALSLVVATIASYTALDLAGRVSAARGRAAQLWLVGGAISMGTGIWAMHFIGMLSFELPIPLAYDFFINLLSWLLAVALSAVALYVVSRPAMTPGNITLGATFMGVGICAMHYTGMLAMRMSPAIRYDKGLFIASVLIAIGASFVALWIAFQLRGKRPGTAILAKLASALVMGLAITGMHYTGMEAAEFFPDSVCLAADSANGVHGGPLALIIGLASLSILTITLVISAFDAHVAARNARHADELRSANEELLKVALYDHLTGLPNRLLLEDRMAQAMARADRGRQHCALMFVDLDRFKEVNDTYGHHVGDELLRAVAVRLTHCMRRGDTAARTGGDEFLIVLGDVEKPQAAAQVGAKVLAELSRPFAVKGLQLGISASIGISVYPQDGKTLVELKTNADVAMYRVKQGGRNGYRFFEPGMPGMPRAPSPQT